MLAQPETAMNLPAKISEEQHKSSPSTSTAAAATPSKDGKPIKLRAACNHCFSAKVRCDGNKEGCKRCAEKRLSCIYSESRVGKVVGKRRKRPIDDSIGNINSKTWAVGNSVPPQSMPSPANTQGSEESTKRQCGVPSWTNFIAESDQGFVAFEETADSLRAIEMADSRSYSMHSDATFFNPSGLPTPGLSPPQFTRYLSPAQLETRPTSRQTSTSSDSLRMLHPGYRAAMSRAEPLAEDEETVCIRLLAHIKKHAVDESQPRELQLELLKKCNAAVRRILRSKSVRSDYSCHLLLSSILNHLVRLCERICFSKLDQPKTVDMRFLQDQVHFEATQGLFDPQNNSYIPLSNDQESLSALVNEVLCFTNELADMLKRKPLNGFQMLGRQECLHVELEQRLKNAICALNS